MQREFVHASLWEGQLHRANSLGKHSYTANSSSYSYTANSLGSYTATIPPTSCLGKTYTNSLDLVYEDSVAFKHENHKLKPDLCDISRWETSRYQQPVR